MMRLQSQSGAIEILRARASAARHAPRSKWSKLLPLEKLRTLLIAPQKDLYVPHSLP